MFGSTTVESELLSGERHGDDPLFRDGFDDLCFEISVQESSSGWGAEDRQTLPDLDSIPPGPFLSVLLESVDRSRLNGFDLVSLLQARERMVNHTQAESMGDAVEISYAAPGDADSDPARLGQAFEFASDEIRAALTLTRRSAEYRLSFATDLVERLPRVWQLLSGGQIDVARARVLSDGTAHLTVDAARRVVDALAAVAPRLTTGQLRARIRRLCVETNPEDARQRYQHAIEERRLVIEPTEAGSGNVHLLDIPIDEAKAIGRRVNAHMISMRKHGDSRSHDNLRADIAVDLMLGADPANRGRGTMEMRVAMTTLAGLDDKAAEIPGMGPVIADVARKFADQHPRAEWRAIVTDDIGHAVGVVTTRRRPTKALSRYIEATQPTCSFPGCRMPTADCDYDHLLPWSLGGETSTRNGGPKCRHDHILKDGGWTHQRLDGHDRWGSPLGRTYITQGQSP